MYSHHKIVSSNMISCFEIAQTEICCEITLVNRLQKMIKDCTGSRKDLTLFMIELVAPKNTALECAKTFEQLTRTLIQDDVLKGTCDEKFIFVSCGAEKDMINAFIEQLRTIIATDTLLSKNNLTFKYGTTSFQWHERDPKGAFSLLYAAEEALYAYRSSS